MPCPLHGRKVLLPCVLALLLVPQHQNHMDTASQQRWGTASGGEEGKNSATGLRSEGAEVEHILPNSCQRTTRMNFRERPRPLKGDTVLDGDAFSSSVRFKFPAKYFLVSCALKMSTACFTGHLFLPISSSPGKDLLLPISI